VAYAYLTFAQAKTALAQRLYEAGKVFFTDTELGLYVKEALQAFNAFANFYRQQFTFNTTAGQTWYDITTASGTLRPISVTDLNLVNQIEYHLLEPQTATYPLTWTGSLQFNVADILNAIQQFRDQLLSESGCTITQGLTAAVSGRTTLADSVIDIRRVVWIPNSGLGYTVNALVPDDEWSTQSFEANFPSLAAGTPQTFRRSTEPPTSFDVDIQPAVAGNYDVLTVNAGATLSAAASTVLPVPNDWTWAIKYGALAQLLGRDNVAQDAYRSQYCDMRFKMATAAMQMTPALIAARLAGSPIDVESVTNADFYSANWQGAAAGAPTAIYYAGLNLIATNPKADGSGPYAIQCSVVQNMPLPATDGDFLQIGRDDVNAVLNYAQHISMFKCGGAEFAATGQLLKDFIRHCALYNSKLAGLSPYLEFLDGRGREDERLHPTFGTVNPKTLETA